MNDFESITVTSIENAFYVYSPKGRRENIKNRLYYGLSFCKSGQITYIHNNKKIVSDANHAIFLPKDKSYTIIGDKSGEFTVINFLYNGEFKIDDFISIKIKNNERYIKNFEAIQELSLFSHNKLKAMELFYRILDRLNSETNHQNSTLSDIISYIEKNYCNQQISNNLISESAGISEIYMRQLFKKHLNTSPKQYILEMRIQKAKLLLSGGRTKINTVAEECGFTTVQHFCRAFKGATSQTPSEYRNLNTKKLL